MVGATGYIGRAVVRECLRQNYDTYALVRTTKESPTNTNNNNDSTTPSESTAATFLTCDVTNATQVLEQMQRVVAQTSSRSTTSTSKESSSSPSTITAVISCLASRSGVKTDAYLIDYQATLHCLQAAIHPTIQASHFILLSAYCVQKPLLQFQQGTIELIVHLDICVMIVCSF